MWCDVLGRLQSSFGVATTTTTTTTTGLDKCDARTRPLGVPGVFRYYIPSPFASPFAAENAAAATAAGTGSGIDGGNSGIGGAAASGVGTAHGGASNGSLGGVMDDNSIGHQGYVLCQTTVVEEDGGEEVIPNAPGNIINP